jgi:hypothetical protein
MLDMLFNSELPRAQQLTMPLLLKVALKAYSYVDLNRV